MVSFHQQNLGDAETSALLEHVEIIYLAIFHASLLACNYSVTEFESIGLILQLCVFTELAMFIYFLQKSKPLVAIHISNYKSEMCS